MKSEVKRLFVALPLPPGVRDLLGSWIRSGQRLLPFRRWTHPEDLHITLYFLGDTGPEQMAPLLSRLGKIAAAHSPFRLSLNACGSFGRPAFPSILWAGVGGETERLRRLQADMRTSLVALGFADEVRPYRPHITLGRQYTGDKPLEKLPERLGAELIGDPDNRSWLADRVVLFESRPGKTPMYSPIASYPLGG
jgi:2'-5' RNA ligase